MTYKTIITEVDENIGVIQLNRPEALNALCAELMTEVSQALETFGNDDHIGTIVLTGNEKAFAAGADIKEMQSKTFSSIFAENFLADDGENFRHCRKPVIAAVSGYALGGGCELAMLCDFILASDSAQFGQPEIKIGTIPGFGGSQRLARSVGKSKAMDMCLSGRMMGAEEAERCGLVSRVFASDSFMQEVRKVAKTIASMSLPALMMAKECVNQSFETSLQDGLLFERRMFHATFSTEDQKEGMAAFIEKRKPNWANK